MRCLFVVTLLFFEVLSSEEVDKSENKLLVKNVSKRGIFPDIYAGYYGYQNPLIGGQLAKIPLGFKSPPLIGAPVPHVIRSGGAIVTSYNVNYPRYPYYPASPITPVLPVSTAIASNTIIPPAPPLIPLSPLIPANVIVANRPVPTLPIIPQKPIAEPLPLPGILGTPSINVPQNVIPIGGQGESSQIPSTSKPAILPARPWRPVIVHQHDSASTPTGVQKPPINLLPPYESLLERGSSQNIPTPSRAYLFPHLQQILAEQDHQQRQIQQHQLLETQQTPEFSGDVSDAHFEQQRNFVTSYDVPLHGNKRYNY